MSSFDTFNGAFFISIATIVCGLAAVGVRYIYKTKCAQCELCGCIKIQRDVDNETRIDLARPSRPPALVGGSDSGVGGSDAGNTPMPNISVLTGESTV